MIGLMVLLVYIAVLLVSFLVVRFLVHRTTNDFTARKTVTFGDESAVVSNRFASTISVITIFVIWGSFTGSAWLPGFLHAPGPFVGDTAFNYTLESADGARDDATVYVHVAGFGQETSKFTVDPGAGFAKDDAVSMNASRTATILFDANDETTRRDGARVVAIDGVTIGPEDSIRNDVGRFALTDKGAISFTPPKGLQMEPIWLPAPEAVVGRMVEIANDGYRGSTLWGHLGYSLFRVVTGFILGALLGIPLGYAMGLSNWFRGWFEPIVEFMRPVPPLALIPLVIIWFGIGETGKIILLFLASLWIMAISARAGVSGVNIAKVHVAYSLGASKFQIMRYVIMPNSLPEIFTGARVAMGVCWGTVVV